MAAIGVLAVVRRLLQPATVIWLVVLLNVVLSVILLGRISSTPAAESSVSARGDAMAGMLALSELQPADRRLARSILSERLQDHREALSAIDVANRDVIAAFASRPFDRVVASQATGRLLEARSRLWLQATATYLQVFEALPPDAQDALVSHARERRSFVFPETR